MIATGRPEFADIVWPLVTNEDHNIQLPSLRRGTGFIPAVLGERLATDYKTLSEKTRTTLLGGFIEGGGIEGLETAMRFAFDDDSFVVRTKVFKSLIFIALDGRRKTLQNPARTSWKAVAERGYFNSIASDDIVARLRSYQKAYLDGEARPESKLARLFYMNPRGGSGTICGDTARRPKFGLRLTARGAFTMRSGSFPLR